MPYYAPPEGSTRNEDDVRRMADNVAEWHSLAKKPLSERIELARTFGPNWASIMSGLGDQ